MFKPQASEKLSDIGEGKNDDSPGEGILLNIDG